MDVALFIPCYVDQLAPAVGLATLRILERIGCRVDYDPAQTCCGQPFVTMGAREDATRLARRHLARFEQAEVVVCPSASCVATVRRRYTRLLPDLSEKQRRICAHTFELGEFLVNRVYEMDLGSVFRHRVAFLPSCHGLRQLGLGTASEYVGVLDSGLSPTEQLLRRVKGLELVYPERPDECCGFGGAFSHWLPEVSARIGRARLQALAATGAEYVTATDMSCLLHLEAIRRREGSGPRAIHMAEILAGRTVP